MLETILTAALGGTVEALAGKALDSSPTVAKRIKKMLTMVEEQKLTDTEAAIRSAVEAARQETLNEYRFDEDKAMHAAAKDAIALLEKHDTFAQSVTKQILFRGQPDLARPRQTFLDLEPNASSERWTELEPILIEFFDTIESHLEADLQIGPLLRDTKKLTTMAKLQDSNAIIAEASREAVALQKQLVKSSDQTETAIQTLIETSGKSEAHLSELKSLILEALQQGGVADSVTRFRTLSSVDKPYLRGLRDTCNYLPLAQDTRNVGTQNSGYKNRATLQNVYIDLQTTLMPTIEQFRERLEISEEKWLVVQAEIRQQLTSMEGQTRNEFVHETVSQIDSVRQFIRQHDQQFGQDESEASLFDKWGIERETFSKSLKQLKAIEALRQNRQLVLLGDPGGGKTSFVNHIALTMAGALLDEEPEWNNILDNQFDTPLFPIRIVLRRFSTTLTAESKPDKEMLYAAIQNTLGEESGAAVRGRLEDPNTLLLLDGLDEVPTQSDSDDIDRRRIVLQSVRALLIAHPNCRVLVTCRIKPYRQGDYQLGLPDFTLAPLDSPRIKRFTELWYDELARLEPHRAEAMPPTRTRLLNQLELRPTLAEMAQTPLLLTMLAQVNAHSPLPEGRVDLYALCVKQLLWEWEQWRSVSAAHVTTAERAAGAEQTGLQYLLGQAPSPINLNDFERILWKLTYNAHEQSGDETADLAVSDVREALIDFFEKPKRPDAAKWAEQVIQLMQDHSGLLLWDDDANFTFPHRTFQEYLAARHLLSLGNRPKTAAELATSDTWREAILLACAHRAKDSPYDVQQILREMMLPDVVNEGDRKRLLVAGQALQELGQQRLEGADGADVAKQLCAKLTALMQQQDAPPAERLAAGMTLARRNELPPDLDEFVTFTDSPLGYPFRLGRYPITNHQYGQFIESKEFDRDMPRYWDSNRLNLSTQPVVGVTWDDAQAYCKWLTNHLRAASEDEEIRLPTEAEWEWAASGAEKRTYPWGSDPETDKTIHERVNCAELHSQTTPVHMYPAGATADEVWDLCGNVWEWSQDDHEAYEGVKTLRGAAWYSAADAVNSSARDGDYSWDRDVSPGFRVVVVPLLSE